MKLRIIKDQIQVKEYGRQVVKFTILAKAEFTSEEQALLKHYDLFGSTVATWKDSKGEVHEVAVLNITGNGMDLRSHRLREIQDFEGQVIQSCRGLTELISQMVNHKGETVFEL